jgi:clathrin heavy chain
MNPNTKVIALRAQNGTYLQLFNIEMKSRMKSYQLKPHEGQISFWRWISPSTVALVSGTSVYHWTSEPDKDPVKMFDRHENLANTQVISYVCSEDAKWVCLAGIKQAADGSQRLDGAMQLYSTERSVSQPLEGHAAVFAQLKLPGATEESTLFCFAQKNAMGGKINVIEVGDKKQPQAERAYKRQADVPYPPGADGDFPVSMQYSKRYQLLFLITKMGTMHIYDVETLTCICTNRISEQYIFATAPTGDEGFMGVSRDGKVVKVSMNGDYVIRYITETLRNMELAVSMAKRANLSGCEDVFGAQFNNLLQQMRYKEAAELCAESPQQCLRTPQTIQRFQTLPQVPNQPQPILQYFNVLLSRGTLNKIESVELAKPVIQQGRKELLEGWLKDQKLEGSEELGDLLQPLDPRLALSVYLRAQIHGKVIQCFMQTNDFEKILVYCKKTAFQPDFPTLLNQVVNYNPPEAVRFAQFLHNNVNEAGIRESLIQPAAVRDVFMGRNMLQQTTEFLLDALKDNKAEEGELQTSVLEINLMAAPAVADAILGSSMFTYYDKQKIAGLCEQANLFQRALEHYSEMADIKRVIVNTHLIQFEFLRDKLKAMPLEDRVMLFNELLSKNMQQNLRIVVTIAAECTSTLEGDNGMEPLSVVEMLETHNTQDGLFQVCPFPPAGSFSAVSH